MGKQDVEKLKFYSILVIAFLVVSLFLTLDGVENLTGAAISIQTQDYSENLQNLYPNSFQTYVYLEQPTLLTLETKLGVKAIAGEIADEINFIEEITKMYEQKPPYRLLSDSSFAVQLAASDEDSNFRDELTCLNKIGQDKAHHGTYEMYILSELKFQKCAKSEKKIGFMKHTYYETIKNNEGSKEFLCSQENEGLFTVDLTSGRIEKGVHC